MNNLNKLKREKAKLLAKRDKRLKAIALMREQRNLKSEISHLKHPKRRAAFGFVGAFMGEAGKLAASGVRAASKPKRRRRR